MTHIKHVHHLDAKLTTEAQRVLVKVKVVTGVWCFTGRCRFALPFLPHRRQLSTSARKSRNLDPACLIGHRPRDCAPRGVSDVRLATSDHTSVGSNCQQVPFSLPYRGPDPLSCASSPTCTFPPLILHANVCSQPSSRMLTGRSGPASERRFRLGAVEARKALPHR
jgi:hypothetical protein